MICMSWDCRLPLVHSGDGADPLPFAFSLAASETASTTRCAYPDQYFPSVAVRVVPLDLTGEGDTVEVGIKAKWEARKTETQSEHWHLPHGQW
jgi:hypothetical protein